LVRQMLEYLGGRDTSSSYTIGQAFTTPADKDGSLPAVDTPGGKRVDEVRKNSLGEQSVDATEKGFYRLRDTERDELVAMNHEHKEADLTKVNMDDVIAGIPSAPSDANAQSTSSVLTAEEKEAKQRLWLPLLLTALALFVMEAVIARRIRLPKLI